MTRARVGLSGWTYDAWRGDFYPADLPRRRWLAHVAERFDTVEVNGTFYGLVSPATFRSWRAEVPRGFTFAVKGSRYVTHQKKLRDPERTVANFFAQGVLELDDALGPVLWQLPANLHFDARRIEAFLSVLPHHTDDAVTLARQHDDRVTDVAYGPGTRHRVRHVLEVRHESYWCDELVRLARRHGVALAVSHAGEWPITEEVTAGFVYVMWQSSCGWVTASVPNPNGTGSKSPGCGSHFEKSIVRPFSRHGVPVLNRASRRPQVVRLSLRCSAD